MIMGIKNNLEKLKERDVMSLLMFCLYKLVDIPEYSSLSELCYVLDKTNLYNLCEFFGGQTIKIPTLDELESLLYALLLYQYVNIEGKSYDDAIALIGHDSSELRDVKKGYRKLCTVLENYSFAPREEQ